MFHLVICVSSPRIEVPSELCREPRSAPGGLEGLAQRHRAGPEAVEGLRTRLELPEILPGGRAQMIAEKKGRWGKHGYGLCTSTDVTHTTD